MTKISTLPSKNKQQSIDVIFVHGLEGDAKTTWMADVKKDKTFWPKWLHQHFATAAVHMVELPLKASNVGNPNWSLAEVATSLADKLRLKKIGQRPTVFVAHSLGGLVTKQLIHSITISASPNADKSIAQNTKAIFFLATPHTGSSFGSYFLALARFFGLTSTLLDTLTKSNSSLPTLSQWFRDWATAQAVEVYSFYETVAIAESRPRHLLDQM